VAGDDLQSARELFRAGRPAAALEPLSAAMRADPSSTSARIFLFQLLAVLGEWDRAENQLRVVADLDPKLAYFKKIYVPAIAAERSREAILTRGEGQPTILGDPPPWMALIAKGIELYAKGHSTEAAGLLLRARQDSGEQAAIVNEQPCSSIADADVRFGSMLEVIIESEYYWVPLTRVKEILVEAPAHIRDTLWLPAQFIWVNGGQALGLLPVRYPGIDPASDAELQLGHRTDWTEISQTALVGAGQRVLAVGSGDLSLLELRSLRLN
jgi:type VI secretion system protein ImpE